MYKLLIIICLIVIFITSSFLYSVSKENKKLVAHYMQWFKFRHERGNTFVEHWKWNGEGTKHNPFKLNKDGFRDIASVYYPLIGMYDSGDEDVLEYHILTAKAVGIEGFVVDWYGPNKTVDYNFQKLMKLGKKYDFEAAICYEEKLAFPSYRQPKDREEAVEFAKQDFQYIMNNYGKEPNYLEFKTSPLLFMFVGYGNWGDYGEKIFRNNELAELIEFLNKDNFIFIRQNLKENCPELRAGFAWVGNSDNEDNKYNTWFYQTATKLKKENKFDLIVGSVNPGFNDEGVWGWGNGPRFTPRKNGMLYKIYWDRIYKYNPDMVQIVTWNDFEEGTVIEPTYQDRFFYVNKTEEYIEKYSGRKPNLKDNQLPFKLFQLRKKIKDLDNEKIAKKMNKKIDVIALNLFKTTPDNSEKQLKQIAKELNYKFVDYYTGKNEYTIYSGNISEKRLKNIFNSADNFAMKSRVESSSYRDGTPESAVDGDIGTRWSSKFSDKEWIVFDLNEKKSISCIIIDWENAFGQEYFVDISDNKKDWKSIYHQTNGHGQLETLNFPKVETRYVRLSGIKRATNWGYSFWEFGIYANKPE